MNRPEDHPRIGDQRHERKRHRSRKTPAAAASSGWSRRSATGIGSRRWSRRVATLSWAVERLLVFIQDRRLSLLDDMLRAPDRLRRVDLDDLADAQPVEEHPDGGPVLLDRGGRKT